MEETIKSYKGFNKDMTCKGFQYEEGKDYETEMAKCCESGFHACKMPLDVFGCYKPSESVYHEVIQSGEMDESCDDTKVASTKIKIGNCENSLEYSGKHVPGYANECKNCNKLKKHKEYLESKRQFTRGEKVSTLEELLKCEWVIWHGKTTHIEFIKSLQLRIVMKSLECGLFHKAIKKEGED